LAVTDERNKPNLVKSAARTLDVLEYLAEHPGGASLSDMQVSFNIPFSSLYNLASTMVQKGFLSRNDQTNIYHLGPKVGRLASSYFEQVDIIQLAEPYMRALTRLTGETTSLTVLRDDRIVFIHKVVGESVLQIVNPVGKTLAAHATGSGKVMLACLPETDLDRLYPQEDLPVFTSNTISTKTKLKEVLKEVAECGYSYDNEESSEGIWALASCIRDRLGRPLAAMSVVALVGRIQQKNCADWIQPIKEMAAEASFALGFPST
jgi:DNA-binding IclR family transcriptional regulator